MAISRHQARVMQRNARRRRRGRADWLFQLSRTHDYAPGATSIATGTVFPSRLEPISWQCVVEVTGASPNGLIFEFGDSTVAGLALWIESGALGVAAGHVSDNNEGVTLDPSVTLSNGQRAQIGLVVIPGAGEVQVFLNGDHQATGTSAGGTLEATNGWSASGDGGYGVAVQGTVTPRVPVGARVAPSNFDVISRLSAFQGQTLYG